MPMQKLEAFKHTRDVGTGGIKTATLKPCPFCGSDDIMDGGEERATTFLNCYGKTMRRTNEFEYSIQCRKCGGSIVERGLSQHDGAVLVAQERARKKWNKRT